MYNDILHMIKANCPLNVLLQTCDIDIDKEVEKEKQLEPYIVVAGKPGMDRTQFFIVCEQALLFESKSLRDAFVDLIATYYVFNISYPKSVCGVHLFFQHFVFNLKNNLHALLSYIKI